MSAMPERFPAAVVRDWGKLEIADIPAFPTGPYDAVCRIEACSICAATDSHLVEGSFPRAWCSKLPFVLGHESAGHVIAVGEKVRNFRVGQLVVRPMWLPDGLHHAGIGSAPYELKTAQVLNGEHRKQTLQYLLLMGLHHETALPTKLLYFDLNWSRYDHSVPPQVSWATYQFIIDCVNRYGSYV